MIIGLLTNGCKKGEALYIGPFKVGGNYFPTMDQSDAKYSAQWGDPKYDAANSAVNEPYLSNEEKKLIYYLIIARMNPPLFAATYATGYKGANG